MIYTVHVTDDLGGRHGWTIENMDSPAQALSRADQVLTEDNPGCRRESAEVFPSRADSQRTGESRLYGPA